MSDSSGFDAVDVRAAIAFRAARTALGWSQEDTASQSGLAKTTIARIETATGQNSLSNIFALVSTYQSFGIKISDLMLDCVTITLGTPAVEEAAKNLTNPNRKRKRKDAGQKRSLTE